jgi:hypothetical protein
MNKLKLFLSSRVNSSLIKLEKPYSLGDLRSFLRKKLELETFLHEEILEVVINEESFNSSIKKTAFDNCMDKMRESNIIVILYNGEAGWSLAGSDSTNGICHEEFLIAVSEFSDMSFMINLSAFFDPATDTDILKKNNNFKKDIETHFGHSVSINATTTGELEEKVFIQIKQYVLTAIEKSFTTQKYIVGDSSVFADTLDWSKLNYSERINKLEKKLTTVFNPLAGFQDVLKQYHAVPDNMSVSDARNTIGRPFLEEHNFIKNKEHKKYKTGVIHFVAVYGSVTETQVKTIVGYPDLTVIKASFGFYLWEKNMHIQIFFLKNCINPQTVQTRSSQVSNWLSSSKEQKNILARAKGRYAILEAMNANRIG